MSPPEIQVREELYKISATFTEVTEFGQSLGAFLAGEVVPPPQGLRFDVAFEGSIEGKRLNGDIRGVDYLHIRSDGRTELHIHAAVRTEDGASVAVFAGGLGHPAADKTSLELREHVSFTTADPNYTWVNELAIWAVGEVNPASGEIRITGYAV